MMRKVNLLWGMAIEVAINFTEKKFSAKIFQNQNGKNFESTLILSA